MTMVEGKGKILIKGKMRMSIFKFGLVTQTWVKRLVADLFSSMTGTARAWNRLSRQLMVGVSRYQS